MDGRIRFETKEEGNARREQAFLALSPAERFEWFLRSFVDRAVATVKARPATDNFIIRKRGDALRG